MFIIPFKVENTQKEPNRAAPHLLPPSSQDIQHYFSMLAAKYDMILVITLSSWLSQFTEFAEKAAATFQNHASVHIVDSQTTSIGLGVLVEKAAGAISSGASPSEVEQIVRMTITRIYMLLFIPELTTLEPVGLLNHSQAVVGEILGILPIFTMEGGRLTPLEKVHTSRHLFESFQEFLEEFHSPERVALMTGPSQSTLRTRSMRQYVQDKFRNTLYHEYPFNPHLTALFGMHCAAMAVVGKG